MAYDGNKLTKVEALKALAERVNNDFITKTEAQKQIKQEVAQAGHAKFEKVDTLPEVADAQENVMYLLYNEKTKHYDIYAKIGENMEQLDDTTVDLSGYVQKEEGKELITTEEKTKLAGIAEGATKVEQSQTNGNIKINGEEVTVFAAEIATEKSQKCLTRYLAQQYQIHQRKVLKRGDSPLFYMEKRCKNEICGI